MCGCHLYLGRYMKTQLREKVQILALSSVQGVGLYWQEEVVRRQISFTFPESRVSTQKWWLHERHLFSVSSRQLPNTNYPMRRTPMASAWPPPPPPLLPLHHHVSPWVHSHYSVDSLMWMSKHHGSSGVPLKRPGNSGGAWKNTSVFWCAWE